GVLGGSGDGSASPDAHADSPHPGGTGRTTVKEHLSDILCISSIDWDFIWQGHQEIMSTLAAEGHRVVFLENTGVRAPKVRDLPPSSLAARKIVPSEQRLFREADLVFVTSEALRRRAALFSSRVHLFPFGVSFDRFDEVRGRTEPVPGDLASLPRPIVGYVGG